MLQREERVQSASMLAEAPEEDLFAALGSASLALGTPAEALALGALGRAHGVESLKRGDMTLAADLAADFDVVERGRSVWGDFLGEVGDALKAQLCGDFAQYLAGEKDADALFTAIGAVVTALVAGTVWGPLIAYLIALLFKVGLRMLCKVEGGVVTA